MKRFPAQWSRKSSPLVAMTLCVSEGFLERQKGLLGTPWLQCGEGLLLSPCNSIHMWFMQHAIDVVYLNRAREVCKLVENLQPWTLSGCWRAHSVVELTAGSVADWSLRVGDCLQWGDS